MYPPQNYDIMHKRQVDDGIGGYVEDWAVLKSVEGYLDLLQGSDLNNAQNAFIEDSTHVLVIPQYTTDITDGMRVLASDNKFYEITYADNPANVNHHNELFCKFGGVWRG